MLTDEETEAHTRPQSKLEPSEDWDMTYLVSSPRHVPLETTAHADLASVGSPREGGADLSCWIRSSPSLMTLSVASRVAVCCCWNCLISSWTASTESAQTSSSISFWRSSIHVHNCGGESRVSTQGTWGRPGLNEGDNAGLRLHVLSPVSAGQMDFSSTPMVSGVCAQCRLGCLQMYICHHPRQVYSISVGIL